MTFNYPLNVQIEITQACNHHCFYCYNSWRAQNSSELMSQQVANSLAEVIVTNVKPFQTTITGGEPMLNYNVILILLEKFAQDKISCGINTNLSLLTRDRIRELRRVSKFGILGSLPHFEEPKYRKITGRDDFAKVQENLEGILAEDVPVMINMVVHALNFGDVYEEGEYLFKKFGIRRFAATPMTEPSYRKNKCLSLDSEKMRTVIESLVRLNKEYSIDVDILVPVPRCFLPEQLRESNLTFANRGCGAGTSTMTIAHDGSIRPCSHMPINYGNLLREPFTKIWRRMNPFRNNEYIPKECQDCSEQDSCRGSCRITEYKEGYPLDKPHPLMQGKLSQRRIRNLPPFDQTRRYQINPDLKIRNEREGVYAFYGGRLNRVILGNEALISLVKLLSQKPFDFNEINAQDKEKFEQLIRRLIEGGQIIVAKD